MADHPDFPDCNTCMMIDKQNRLWLFWPIILDNHWESCLTNYKVSSNYDGRRVSPLGPRRRDVPEAGRFLQRLIAHVEKELGRFCHDSSRSWARKCSTEFKKRAGDKLYQRLGWQPRCKPTVLPSGRILLPLYSDTFSIGIMAVSDDGGNHWYASKPLIGVGAIQPTRAPPQRRHAGGLHARKRPARNTSASASPRTTGSVGGPSA